VKLLIRNIEAAENAIRSRGHNGPDFINICEYIETIPLVRGDDIAPDTPIRIATVSREWLEGGVHAMVLDIPDSHLKVDQKNVKRIAELEQIVLSVGHIGVDFGYGVYEIDQATIDKARQLTNKGGAE
jgi:hypothetical protein